MRNLKERTGKDLETWIEIVRTEGPEGEIAQAEWLKSEHGMGTNYAGWIAGRANGAKGAEDYDPEALVEAMFAGKKAALRPLYDELLRIGLGLGPDVTASPGTTIVPLYRGNVFAQLKPTTNTRIDVGLCLKGVDLTATAPVTHNDSRLIDTGGAAKGDRITHRIPVSSEADIDEYLRMWMRRAYEAAGKQQKG